MELQTLQTDQCIAVAKATGLRCRNKPHPSSRSGPWCANHGPDFPVARSAREELEGLQELESPEEGPGPELVEDGEGPGSPDPGPGSSRGPESTEREPRRADFLGPSVQEPSGSGPLEGLPSHGGPEEEGGSRQDDGGRDVDPALFRGLREDRSREPEGELQEEELEGPGGAEPGGFEIHPEGGPGGSSSPGASLLARCPGPYGIREGRKVQALVCNRIFESTGKPPLSEDELEFGAEPWAAAMNEVLGAIDPNSPWGAMSLWAVAVVGPRYAGDAARKVGERLGIRTPEPGPGSREEAEPEAREEEGDRWSPEPEPVEEDGDQWTAGLEIVR